MKVVVNRCYGGFGLSDEACELYHRKKGMKIYKYPGRFGHTEYYTVPKEEYEAAWERMRNGDTTASTEGMYWYDGDLDRNDPVLAEVVEELGEKANGNCASLAVVEIPDDVVFEIDEYDGIETIREQHRSW